MCSLALLLALAPWRVPAASAQEAAEPLAISEILADGTRIEMSAWPAFSPFDRVDVEWRRRASAAIASVERLYAYGVGTDGGTALLDDEAFRALFERLRGCASMAIEGQGAVWSPTTGEPPSRPWVRIAVYGSTSAGGGRRTLELSGPVGDESRAGLGACYRLIRRAAFGAVGALPLADRFWTEGSFGTLAIAADRPVRIYVDGRDTGLRAAFVEVRAEPGRHEVRWVDEERDESRTAMVTVEAGVTTSISTDFSE